MQTAKLLPEPEGTPFRTTRSWADRAGNTHTAVATDEPLFVYLTWRNQDMVEGRGPMVKDRCFLNKADADAYVDSQPGLMGRRMKWSQQQFGDWQVEAIEVEK